MERYWTCLICVIALTGTSINGFSQTRELTAADRLAVLYTSKLAFDASGEPTVKIGITDNVTALSFTPSEAIRIFPTGLTGPEIVLDRDQTYHVRLLSGAAGTYRHHVVLERFHPSANDSDMEGAKSRWHE